MARHLVPSSLLHFNALTSRITLPEQLGRISAFDRGAFIRKNVRGGVIRYSDAYKTATNRLGRLPMYAMVDGTHHPKWVSLRTNSDKRLGNKLFNILLRNHDGASLGIKANHLYSLLNESSNEVGLHKGLLTLPFIQNPAVLKLNEEDRAAFAAESLNNITQLPDWFYSLRGKAEYKGTYNEVHAALGDIHLTGHFTNFTFKKGTISVCYGAIIDFASKKVLAMLTLNREYQEYYLLHKYSKSIKKLHPQIFNIVVDEEFSRNTGEHYAKELWTLVRKGFCEAAEVGVTTETIDGSEFFLELYGNNISKTTAPLGPLEQIEENAEMQQKFLESTVTATTLRKRNIVLID